MNSDKKQTKQIVVVGVLLAIFAGYGAFMLLGKKAPTPPQAPKPTSLASNSPASVVNSAEPESAGLALGAAPAVMRKDPFTPAFSENDQKPLNVADLKPRGRMTAPAIPTIGGLPPIGAFPRGSGLAPLSGEAVPPLPEFRVTGVVVGEKNVAIVQSGQDERQVVREGQFIGGRYKVLSISKSGVVLKGDGRKIYVKLGGAKNAS